MHIHVYSCNVQKSLTNGTSLDVHQQRMDKFNAVHMHNGILLHGKENEIMIFAGKWMELEIIILNKVSQT